MSSGNQLQQNGAVTPVVPDAAAVQDQQQFQLWPFLKSMFTRLIMFWVISSLIRNFFGSKNESNESAVSNKQFPPSFNLFSPNQRFNYFMYLSSQANLFPLFDDEKAKSSLIWEERNLFYGDWESGPQSDGSHIKSLSFPTPDVLKKNGSIYLHVFLVKDGLSHFSGDSNYVVYSNTQLNKYKKKYYRKTTNLLTGKTEQNVEEQQKADEGVKWEMLNYWHPNITVNLVTDFTAWSKGQVPSPLDEAVKFDTKSNRYYPIIFFNTYWNLGNEYQPLNETVEQLNLTITFSPLSLFKWQLYASQQMRNKWSKMLGGEIFEESDSDQDAIKQALIETSPILLAITIIVSILHTVLEMLAFKNDIQFWRSRKSLEGLSVRSVLFNIFQSLIVFLYVCDNDSSWVIRMSIGFGLLIEIWKIPKCLDVKINYDQPIFGFFPRVQFSDKGSYVESATKEYDQMAFKYLSWALFPLLGGYAIYSLVYDEQKGWYSWILGMLYGFLLTFGFIMMTPQLFINYKLKSVAHLPWRMLTYKFINTFIDDLFAFVIKMPILYRLGCFRDDIIFLIYIYQRWIYRVDPKRINEFGTSGEDNKTLAVENGQTHQQELQQEISENTKCDDEILNESKKEK
uniref:Cleft lip and palate associated transmembrane protein n=1 Tax=Meloidogyne hapla TaxID=6305 RepID=A0A1I8AYB9_MELHA